MPGTLPVGVGNPAPLYPPTLTYAVQISFTPPYATPAWIDITRWCRGFKTTSGRLHEGQRVVPGTATVTLDNNDARFNPWNTAGPYALLGAGAVGGIALSPGTPLRIQATWQGTLYNIWYGYVDSWTPVYKNPITGDIDIAASDILALLTLADILSTQYHDRVVADGPVAYYRMNDPSGIVCADSISGNNGFYQGQPSLLAAGALLGDTDAAVDLAGQAYISLPTSLAPTGNNPYSWEIWISLDKPLAAGPTCLWLGNNPGTQEQFGIAIYPTAIQWYAVDPTGAVWLDAAMAATFDVGTWHQVVVTYDGNVGSLYFDGQLGDSQPAAAHTAMTTPGQFDIGSCPGTAAASLPGRVDEVSIYNRALTAAQVAAHFNLGGFAYNPQWSDVRFQAVCSAAGLPAGLYTVPVFGASMVQGATSSLVGTKIGDYLQTIADTEQGAIYQGPDGVLTFYGRHYPIVQPTASTSQATFEDAPTSQYFYLIDNFVPAVDQQDLWNEVTASAQPGTGTPPQPSGAPQTTRAPSSITQFGKRSYPSLTTLLTTTDAEVLALTQSIQQRYSNPQPRVRTIVMDSATNSGGNLPQMLGRRFWDRVTVIYHGGNGGTAFTQDSLIEGIEHNVQADPGTWITTFRLSPADTANYLILDDPVKGKLDNRVLAF